MNLSATPILLPTVEDIRTDRLDLIPIYSEVAQCEKETGLQWRTRFSKLLLARIPGEWPPEHWEPHVLDFLLDQMQKNPTSVGWSRLIALRDEAPMTHSSRRKLHRTLIGTLGAVPPGSPFAHGPATEIEVGYSILPAYQRHGYATEGLAALLDWLPTQTRITAFVAQTFAHLRASIRVLEKSGFHYAGAGFGEDTILYRKSFSNSQK